MQWSNRECKPSVWSAAAENFNEICKVKARLRAVWRNQNSVQKLSYCAEVKPQFFKPESQTLIKAVRPWDRVSVNFKGPVSGPHPYLLIVVDEHSRFPFVFPCKNMKSSTVTQCLSSLFCLYGFPGCVHSDRGAALVFRETRSFLATRGISFSTSTPYHPQGNSQCERSSNQTIWGIIKQLLHSKASFQRTLGNGSARSSPCCSIPCLSFHKWNSPWTLPGVPPQGHDWFCAPFLVTPSRARSSMSPCSKQGRPLCDPLNSWRVIRRILWYVQVMAKKLCYLRLSYRLFPGLKQLLKSWQQTSHRIPRLRAVWRMSYPIAMAIGTCRWEAYTVARVNLSVAEHDSFLSPARADVQLLHRSTRLRKPPDRFGDWSV